MTKHKLLIVAYYWPPAGGGGVQRWVKFVKYLNTMGYDIHVYVPENPSYPLLDDTLLKEVPQDITIVKNRIFEPYELYRKFTGASKSDKTNAGFISEKESKQGLTKRIANWIRGNFFIPDARMFWIRPSYRFLKNYIQQNGIDCIITTGPPHSLHLIGLRLRKSLPIKWIADFRDPWVNMDNRDEMLMSDRAVRKHERLELNVLKTADEVVTVSWYLSGVYSELSKRVIHTITNGFDTDDFSKEIEANRDKFVVGHYGTLGADRNAPRLWKALTDLLNANPDFRNKLSLELIGPVDAAVKTALSENGLSDYTTYIDYLPHHEIIDKMQEASVLLVITNKNANEEGRVTGKIFEYLAAKRAVLGVGSVTSDCARVINETSSGKMCAHEDAASMKVFLETRFSEFQKGNIALDSAEGSKFTRENLTKNLAQLIEN